jgi:hypothetical protein
VCFFYPSVSFDKSNTQLSWDNVYCFRWAVVSGKESVSMKNVGIMKGCTQVLLFDWFQGPSMLLLEHHESSRWSMFRMNHHRLVLPGQSFAKHARKVSGNGPPPLYRHLRRHLTRFCLKIGRPLVDHQGTTILWFRPSHGG